MSPYQSELAQGKDLARAQGQAGAVDIDSHLNPVAWRCRDGTGGVDELDAHVRVRAHP